jgi:hypothetical protein
LLAQLRRLDAVRAVPWARIPDPGGEHDELRLLVAPRQPLRGLVGIEVGYVEVGGPGSSTVLPEVIVRVIEGSAGHDAMTKLLHRPRWVRGRKADEKVVALTPRWPTVAAIFALVHKLAIELTDGRPRIPREIPVSNSDRSAAA